MTYYIGVDPGRTGGIAILDNSGKYLGALPLPYVGDELDIPELVSVLSCYGYNDCKLAIESVGSRPGQGVSSMFRFGFGVGTLHGVFRTLGIAMTTVTPQKWQKVSGGLNGGDKSHTAEWASRMFPTAELKASSRCKKPHEGIVDALGIAYWLYCQENVAK